MSLPTDPALQPGATYRFVVRTAEEAVQTIRERLGENAKVLSVRQLPGQGLAGLFAKPRLEVIAQIAEAAPDTPAEMEAPREEMAAPVGAGAIDRAYGPGARRGAAGSAGTDLPTRLPELLRRAGFSDNVLSRLRSLPSFQETEERPLHQGLAELGRHVRRQASSRLARPLPPRTAFLGTPGVGRTTALCKWLAREVFTRGRMGRVVKAEFDRPNPAEGLAVFCEALGLTVDYYIPSSPDAPAPAAPALQEPAGGFLYADLPGLSLKSPAENKVMHDFLEREAFAGRVLVLNAAYDASMLRRGYSAGSDLGATHVVFTHLDEVEHWGKLWDFLLDGELTPLFLATGPSLTGDCDEQPVDAVLRRTLPGA